MTDSIRIFDPGWRATDATGAILSGAFIDFFDAGTTDPDEAFSDADLQNSLGVTVTCDSGGFPTSDGNSKVTIWRGTAAYRVRLRKSDGTTVWDLDDQAGAFASASIQSSRIIGEAVEYMGTTLPNSQWVFLNGKTIGSAASGATARASDSADTVTLFTLLWNSFDNAVCPIQTSAGSGTTRGASASADFAANKRFPLLDVCERMRVGCGTMGAISSTNRMTGLTNGVNGDTPGAAGGLESTTIALLNLPDHNITITDPGHVHSYNQPAAASLGTGGAQANNASASTTGSATTGITAAFGSTARGGAQTAMNNLPPVIVVPSVLVYAGAP
jgi:hypothetical protein